MILLGSNIKLSTHHLITTLIKHSRTLVIADTTAAPALYCRSMVFLVVKYLFQI